MPTGTTRTRCPVLPLSLLVSLCLSLSLLVSSLLPLSPASLTCFQGVPLAEGEYFASHQREMRRAYYAAISYVDSLVGELLQVLDDEGVANDTIVSM